MLTTDELIHSLPEVREADHRASRCRHRKVELFEGGIARGITLAPVNTVADVLAVEQLGGARLLGRGAAAERPRRCAARGRSSRRRRRRCAWDRPAPDVGEHTAEVLDEVDRDGAVAGGDDAAGAVPAAVASRLPLEGVKVADFSWIGVGPITAKALADHGATVVHVETDRPADRLRLVGPFKDDVAGINRCQFFGSFNTSKLSLQLDLKHPTGNDIARRLLAWCDIALDSFTAGTMAALGLGYEVARELNPTIIMATTCLLGQTGPAAAAGRLRLPRRRRERLLRDHRLGRPGRRRDRSTPTPTRSPPAS